jgi:hypothetical protein
MRELLQIDISNIRPKLIDIATQVSDEALDNAYGYGLSNDTESFGYKANRLSAAYALHQFFNGDVHDGDDIESIASAIHDGWSYAAYHIDDIKYSVQPHKKAARLALANTPYSELSKEEQDKDRVIARAIIDFLKKH